MFKKILFSVMAVILLAGSFSGTVFAAEGSDGEPLKARGEVIAVDPAAGKFRIEKPDGSVLTFFVNDETAFRGLESLDELEVGWKAGVAAREEEDGKLWAVVVIAGDGSNLMKTRGKILDVNTSAGKFSLETPGGEELRFFVDEQTRYGGQIESLDDLEAGMAAGVAYVEKSEGKLIAVGLAAGYAPDLLKIKGEVTAVDVQLGKFEIETADGSRMRFFGDEKTRYQGQLASLDDLQVGWTAGVAAREEEDGSYTAVLVIGGSRPEGIRRQGKIAAVDPGAGKFRLESAEGELVTFFVEENTSYRGQISSFADLEEGMWAGVAGYEDQDGKLVARLVAAGNLPAQRPEIVNGQGSIKTVNPGAGKFQLEKKDGGVVTVFVDENTSYRGQVSSFGELEKGLRAGFIGYLDGDGQIIARVVIAGSPRSGERPAPERGFPPEGIRTPLPETSS